MKINLRWTTIYQPSPQLLHRQNFHRLWKTVAMIWKWLLNLKLKGPIAELKEPHYRSHMSRKSNARLTQCSTKGQVMGLVTLDLVLLVKRRHWKLLAIMSHHSRLFLITLNNSIAGVLRTRSTLRITWSNGTRSKRSSLSLIIQRSIQQSQAIWMHRSCKTTSQHHLSKQQNRLVEATWQPRVLALVTAWRPRHAWTLTRTLCTPRWTSHPWSTSQRTIARAQR